MRGFIKANRLMKLLGCKFGGYQDSMNRSPRELRFDIAICQVVPLLEQDVTSPAIQDAIKGELLSIQGENYSDYKLTFSLFQHHAPNAKISSNAAISKGLAKT